MQVVTLLYYLHASAFPFVKLTYTNWHNELYARSPLAFRGVRFHDPLREKWNPRITVRPPQNDVFAFCTVFLFSAEILWLELLLFLLQRLEYYAVRRTDLFELSSSFDAAIHWRVRVVYFLFLRRRSEFAELRSTNPSKSERWVYTAMVTNSLHSRCMFKTSPTYDTVCLQPSRRKGTPSTHFRLYCFSSGSVLCLC